VQTLEALQRKIDTADDLLSVVKTMKSLAAVSIRQFEAAAAALERYDQVVGLAWQALFRFHGGQAPEAPDDRAVVLVIGSDQGMCGQFNEALLETARSTMDELAGRGLMVSAWSAGERARAGLGEAGYAVREHFSLPGSSQGVTAAVQDILEAYEAARRRRGGRTLVVVANRPQKERIFTPASRIVLPLDADWLAQYAHRPWPGRSIPRLGLAPDALFSRLFAQYLAVALHRALAQSLAAENAARLAAMQAAEKNIEERAGELAASYRETRQNAITAELLDIVSGFEALGGVGGRG
jgi:F-type H+-transporting ATPase subunit gamma